MPFPAALRKGVASLAIGLACLFVLSGHLSAQVSTASINGTVRDATGAVVPEADLVLQSVETGVERRSVSNSVGVYTCISITTGIYVLSAGR
jgi:type 1 fimbria pilin